MADPIPVVSEFKETEPTAPYCSGTAVGCAVSTCAEIIARYTGKKVANLTALGKSMGARHRADQPYLIVNGVKRKNNHGICPGRWCGRCIYLELKARGLPVAYGRLTWSQIVAHATKGHWIALSGVYGRVPRVGKNSYNRTTPARGRSDSYSGRHMVALCNMGPYRGRLADPDFGSSSRPRMPQHSSWSRATIRSYWSSLSAYGLAYMTKAPPAI